MYKWCSSGEELVVAEQSLTKFFGGLGGSKVLIEVLINCLSVLIRSGITCSTASYTTVQIPL